MKEARKVQGSTFWTKTFPDDNDVPAKVLFKQHNVPLSAERQCLATRDPKKTWNTEKIRWDKIYVDNEVVAEYPEERGYVISVTERPAMAI